MRQSFLFVAFALGSCDSWYAVRGSVSSLQKPLAGAMVEVIDECTDRHSLPQRRICVTTADGTCELFLTSERWSPPSRFLVEVWKSGYESACVELGDVDRTKCDGPLPCYRVLADLHPL